MKTHYYYIGAGLAVGALLAHWTRPRQQTAGVGAITGPKNPCNTLIEADRLDRGASSPSREMILTYQDTADPGVMSECAAQLAQRAKKRGKKVAEEMASLREGVASWYDRSKSSHAGGDHQARITLGA